MVLALNNPSGILDGFSGIWDALNGI